jgi:uncharacterized membrane protein YkoI
MQQIISVVIAIIFITLASGCATGKSQADLQAKANISQNEAEIIAIAKVPGGTVTGCDLSEEKSKLVWSVDISFSGTKDITEVLVDAITGEIVSIEKETPEQQEAEAKEKK